MASSELETFKKTQIKHLNKNTLGRTKVYKEKKMVSKHESILIEAKMKYRENKE